MVCVVKNKLAEISSKNAGFEELENVLKGPTAIAFSYNDHTTPARILKEFKKNHELPVVKAFVLDGKVMDQSAFSAVANLQRREVLLTNFVFFFYYYHDYHHDGRFRSFPKYLCAV